MNSEPQFSDDEIKRYNELYQQANRLIKDLVILDNKPLKNPGFFEKLRLRKAIGLYLQALEVNPKSWQTMFFVAKAHQSLGEMEPMLTWLMRANEHAPGNPSVAKEIGFAAGRLGEHGVAIQVMESAAKQNPNDSALHTNLGLSCLMAGKAAEACWAFERTVQLEPARDINKRLLALAREVQSGKRPAPKTESEISAGIRS